jgi:lipopolysaccharide/colanic/teichoic acid biosynthesis glycosyltransferase
MSVTNYLLIKRILDFFGALLIAILGLPFYILVAFIINLESQGSPIFIQERVGARGRIFRIFKFRSMYIYTPNVSTEALQKSGLKPFTHIGAILRRTSIDELPQVFNVLLGDMSFVGPRPALPTQLDVLELRRKYSVDHLLPGITGLAQVRGRDNLDVEAKVLLDASYGRKISFVEDARILLVETPLIIFTNRGNR